MKNIGTQTIETERLILRRIEEKDAPAVFNNWASDPEVTRFLTWPTHEDLHTSEVIVKSWVREYARDDFYQWAIELKELGEAVGTISVVRIDEKAETAEIGYCMGRKWWRRGIMPEALRAVIKFMIEEAGYNRVEARHDTVNGASGAVMKKAGMTYEGTLRSAGRNNRGLCDIAVYSILRHELKK